MLALVLSLASCEKDDAFEAVNSTENQINNHGSYKLETGSFSSLDDKKLARGLLSLNQQQLTSSKGEPFSIEIDTSYYNLLIDRGTNKKHYTFALETQKGEAYKNIIFTTKTDDTYKTTLAEYNVDQTQLMGIVRGDRSVIIPESDRVFTTVLVSEDFQTAERCSAVCLDVDAIRVEGSSCQDDIHDYGDLSCAYLGESGAATAGYWIFQQNECGNCGTSGGDGPGGMPDTNNGNGNTGEYGSGGSGSNSSSASVPIFCRGMCVDIDNIKLDLFLSFLDNLNELSLWESATQAQQNDLKDFLATNFFSQDAFYFALEVLNFLEEYPNADVDFTNHLSNYDFTEESTEILIFEQNYENRMSQAEISIFNNLSRLQQLDYLHSAYLAQEYAKIYFDDNIKIQYNGKGDAYRHCLWNAIGAAKLGETLMEQLSSAHEIPDLGETNPPLEEAMDLHNNQVGRNIGSQTSFMLMMKVKFAVDQGDTNYISPTNTNGQVIPNMSQIIPTNQ